jgi:hypothetical protein
VKFNDLTAKCLLLILLGLLNTVQSQTINSVRGTWFENSPGGTGCPALEFDADDSPTIFSLTPVPPPNGTIDFTLYALQQYMQDASTKEWENDFPIYNLNPREFVNNLSLSIDETGSSFISWVESKHQYGKPSIVVGTKAGAGETHHIFSNDAHKDAFAVSSTLDERGHPIVAWSEGYLQTETSKRRSVNNYLQQSYYLRYPQREQIYSDTITYVKSWNGTTWEDVGIPLEGHNPTLVLDKQDVPYIGYVRTTANQTEAIVVYWDGQRWKQMGEAVSDSLLDEYHNLSLVLDDEGIPIVALVGLDENERFDLIVAKWNGSSWQHLGKDSIFVAGYNPLDVSLDYRNGKLVLAAIEAQPQTLDFEPSQKLFVKEWNGKSWQLLGGEVAFDAACPIVKLDSHGNPHVAWSQISGDGRRDLYTVVRLSHFVRE